jgi:hypothetical protein
VSRDRGFIPRRQRLRALPYIVEVPRPVGIGVWRALDDIEAWCRARCTNDGYATTSREEQTSWPCRTFLRVHFRAEEDARAFAARFGVPYPPAQEQAPRMDRPLNAKGARCVT